LHDAFGHDYYIWDIQIVSESKKHAHQSEHWNCGSIHIKRTSTHLYDHVYFNIQTKKKKIRNGKILEEANTFLPLSLSLSFSPAPSLFLLLFVGFMLGISRRSSKGIKDSTKKNKKMSSSYSIGYRTVLKLFHENWSFFYNLNISTFSLFFQLLFVQHWKAMSFLSALEAFILLSY